MVKKIESNRFYISFVLLFTILLLCTILTISPPGSVLKNVNGSSEEGDQDEVEEPEEEVEEEEPEEEVEEEEPEEEEEEEEEGDDPQGGDGNKGNKDDEGDKGDEGDSFINKAPSAEDEGDNFDDLMKSLTAGGEGDEEEEGNDESDNTDSIDNSDLTTILGLPTEDGKQDEVEEDGEQQEVGEDKGTVVEEEGGDELLELLYPETTPDPNFLASNSPEPPLDPAEDLLGDSPPLPDPALQDPNAPKPVDPALLTLDSNLQELDNNNPSCPKGETFSLITAGCEPAASGGLEGLLQTPNPSPTLDLLSASQAPQTPNANNLPDDHCLKIFGRQQVEAGVKTPPECKSPSSNTSPKSQQSQLQPISPSQPPITENGKDKSLTTLQQPKPDDKSEGPGIIVDNSNIPDPKTLTTIDKSTDKQKKQDLDDGDKAIEKPDEDGTTETTVTDLDGDTWWVNKLKLRWHNTGYWKNARW